MRYVFAFFFIFLVPGFATAHSYKQGDIAIGHAWAFPSINAETKVFFPLVNNGKKPDALLSAHTEVGAIEFRVNSSYNKTLPLSKIDLPIGKPIPMRASALHLRLTGLQRPLLQGEKILLTLTFAKAGKTSVEVWIEPKAYASPR